MWYQLNLKVILNILLENSIEGAAHWGTAKDTCRFRADARFLLEYLFQALYANGVDQVLNYRYPLLPVSEERS